MSIRRATRTLRHGLYVCMTASFAVACVAESEQAKGPGMQTPSNPSTGTEVASKSIGAEGGSISGGGATIDIPAGALPSNTTIVIKTVDASSVTLPKSSPLAGTVYAFEPDDIEFLKPITISVAVDATKVPASGTGALVLLRSATGQNTWAVRGSALVSASTVTATTTHFSNWAAGAAAASECYKQSACGADASPGGPVGIECKVPASGGGVHCAGDKAPYTCNCDGQTDIIASLDAPPQPDMLAALAVACGAPCDAADAGPGQCTVSAQCSGFSSTAPVDAGIGPSKDGGGGQGNPGSSGWYCSTTSTTNTLSCDYMDGTDTATCYCNPDSTTKGPVDAGTGGGTPPPGGGGNDDPGSFTIPASDTPPTSAEMVDLWKTHCAGVCQAPPRTRGPTDAGTDASGGVDGSVPVKDGGGGAPIDASPPPRGDAGIDNPDASVKPPGQ